MQKNTAATLPRLVIVGGGSAGWMAAAMLAKQLGNQLQIQVIESETIGTVGVGEATIPPILLFNQVLGISEAEFIRATQGTIKLGIQFEHWGQQGDRYLHAFGMAGKDLGLTSFHHFYMRAKALAAQGALADPGDFADYLLSAQAAAQQKCQTSALPSGLPWSQLSYAYHFDAALYAKLLQQYAQARGVTHVSGTIAQVTRHRNGDIDSLQLADGRQVAGDFFIDCSGFRGLLIEQSLHAGYDDWSHWLPCDRALAVPCALDAPPRPYTRAIAHQAGWQWQIPLQHRIGNGLVYCSQYLSDEAAATQLLAALPGEALATPRPIQFKTGRRRQQWSHNCVALGLASGFLEPLESTSLHLVQSGIIRLAKLWPSDVRDSASMAWLRSQYNRQSEQEFCQIRDFIILHYHQTARQDSAFWRHCQQMAIPDSLAHKIALFREHGVVQREQDDLFSEIAWQQVLMGQGVMPKRYHALTEQLSVAQLGQFMADLRQLTRHTVQQMPSHAQWLVRFATA